jgi:class 3 adenylate cyclase/tetratricopeptide (TPR) repeat protein
VSIATRENAAEVLRPYVSRLLISWLRESPDARHRRIQGTVAFVDVSGFTKLTERLSRKGKIGSEEISDTLDHCFGRLLSLAYDYGAGVVKWGGDAVLLLFTDDQHAAHACRAAWGMHQTLRGIGPLETSAGKVRLRVSIGVHSGDFDFFLAGGVHRDLVLAGPAATQTIAMESAAEAGETVISPACAALIDRALAGRPKSGGLLLRVPPDVHPRRTGAAPDCTGLDLESLFSPAIAQHLLAGATDPGHRMVTAAFVETEAIDDLLARAGADAVADALDEALTNVQEAAARHDVTVFDGDPTPGGAKTMLIAGAPRSSSSDEERMLRTIRQILDRAGALPLRAGVNSGRVFADEFGPYYRRTYTVKGDAVNLAARLMARARTGELLASRAVLERCGMAFEAQPVKTFHVKGKAEPIEAFVVGAPAEPRRRETRDAPVVGRERELTLLRERLEAARSGEGSVVELVGEPGIGKSVLVETVSGLDAGLTVLRAAGEEYESSTAYFAVRAMLRDLLGIAPGETAAGRARQLEERVASMAPRFLSWLPLLAIPLELELPSTPEVDRLDEKFRKSRLEQVTSEFLGEILRAPTLLVAEDTHWMDDASLDLLRALVRDLPGRPWLLLATRRPEGAPLAAGAVEIALEPLAEDAVESFIRTATESAPLPAHAVRALAARAGGNPLFLTELVANAGMLDAEALPASVEALVTAQIDRLATADRALLRQASVLGRSFDPDLLAATLEERTEPVDAETWDRLGDFVVRESKGIVRFRHALIRDAAYEGLPYRRRRELHARAAEAIERRADGHPEAEAAHLSLHYFHAQRFDPAWRYSKVAGEQAQSIYAHAEATDLYIRALDAVRHLGDVPIDEIAGVCEALGDSLDRLGLFRRSGSAYRDARRHRRGDVLAEAGLMLKEGWMAERDGRFSQALRWFSRGLRLLEGIESTAARARRAQLLGGYATVRQMQGRSADAIRWCRAAIQEAELADERKALAQAYFVLDWAYMELGRMDEAVSLPLALDIYEELGDLANQAGVYELMGAFAYYEGRWDDAVSLYERARDGFEVIGAPVHRASNTFNIGEIRCDQGRIDEAKPLLEDALRVLRAAGWPSHVATVTRQLGSVALRDGRLDHALGLFEEARGVFVDLGAVLEVADTDGRIAECLLLQGNPRGLEVATAALVRCRGVGERSLHMTMLHRVRGYGLLQSGDLAGASAAFEESLGVGRERGAMYQVALTLDALVRIDGGARAAALESERDSILAELAVVALPPAPARTESSLVRRASSSALRSRDPST